MHSGSQEWPDEAGMDLHPKAMFGLRECLLSTPAFTESSPPVEEWGNDSRNTAFSIALREPSKLACALLPAPQCT